MSEEPLARIPLLDADGRVFDKQGRVYVTEDDLGEFASPEDVQALEDSIAGKADLSALTAHTTNLANPHSTTKTQVGLGNADNTSDANKPVSTATATALSSKSDTGHTHAHFSDTGNPHSTTKAQVGLGNADNTSDANKPVSTAQATAIGLKADTTALTTHTSDTNNPHSVTKTQVGLSNVDNTSDANKPVSTATATALSGKQPLHANLTAVAGATAPGATGLTLLSAATALDAKSTLAVNNVDNTSDANKPVSTAQATAIGLKKTDSMSTNKLLGRGTGGTGAIEEITLGTNLSLTGTTLNAAGGGGGGGDALTTNPLSQFAATTSLQLKGVLSDETGSGALVFANSPALVAPTGIVKGDVGLGNVDNTSDATKNSASATLTNKTLTAPVINSPTGIAKADVGLGNVDNTSDSTKNAASVTLTNKTLTTPVINSPTGIVKADVGLGNVDNTSNATERAASATLTNKTLTSPVINTPTGIVKGDVGLGNVDNTSDANKPVSTATTTALGGKVDKSTATTKGDLYVATASSTITRIGVGANGQRLTADSAQTEGMKWESPDQSPLGPRSQPLHWGYKAWTAHPVVGASANATALTFGRPFLTRFTIDAACMAALAGGPLTNLRFAVNGTGGASVTNGIVNFYSAATNPSAPLLVTDIALGTNFQTAGIKDITISWTPPGVGEYYCLIAATVGSGNPVVLQSAALAQNLALSDLNATAIDAPGLSRSASITSAPNPVDRGSPYTRQPAMWIALS